MSCRPRLLHGRGGFWPASPWASRPMSPSRSPQDQRLRAVRQTDFVYIPGDTYRCPADQRLTWRFTSAEKGMTLHSYLTGASATVSACENPMHDRQGAPDQTLEHEAVSGDTNHRER